MMGPGRYQTGASMWMVMLFVVVLGFAAVFGLKLIPIYLEWWKVEKAVAGALQGGVGEQEKKDILLAILRRLDVDEVRRITNSNFEEFMTINKKGKSVTVDIDYDVVEPLVGNVSVLVHFEKTVAGQ